MGLQVSQAALCSRALSAPWRCELEELDWQGQSSGEEPSAGGEAGLKVGSLVPQPRLQQLLQR